MEQGDREWMKQFDMGVFDALYEKFPQYIRWAKGVTSVNEEDTFEIKMAIVGFSLNCSVEEWTFDQFEYVHNELTPCEGYDENQRLFFALGLGYILGMAAAKKVNDLQFTWFVMVLPGFIFAQGDKYFDVSDVRPE
jgi:hypothetical protein